MTQIQSPVQQQPTQQQKPSVGTYRQMVNMPRPVRFREFAERLSPGITSRQVVTVPQQKQLLKAYNKYRTDFVLTSLKAEQRAKLKKVFADAPKVETEVELIEATNRFVSAVNTFRDHVADAGMNPDDVGLPSRLEQIGYFLEGKAAAFEQARGGQSLEKLLAGVGRAENISKVASAKVASEAEPQPGVLSRMGFNSHLGQGLIDSLGAGPGPFLNPNAQPPRRRGIGGPAIPTPPPKESAPTLSGPSSKSSRPPRVGINDKGEKITESFYGAGDWHLVQ